MRSIPSAPTLAPWSRTVGRPICWWSRATSRGWSRRSTGSVSRRFPPAHRTVDRGHGRIEQRTTWVAPAPPGLNFPHAAQVVIVQRHTTDLAGKHPRTELVYAVTCLTADQADAERLGALLRAHWQVEGLHWVRDVTFAEDASRIRTSAGPQVMAALRNPASSRAYSFPPILPGTPGAASASSMSGAAGSRPRSGADRLLALVVLRCAMVTPIT